VNNFKAVMVELERSINETLADKGGSQLQFDWSQDEREQRERDLGDLRSRVARIPAEVEEESKHLRDRYKDPHPRLFPVAVTFLVPHRSIAQIRGTIGL